MKKGLLAIFAMLCVTATASAQGWGFGPKVGATFANVNGLEGTKMKAGVVAGMFAERDINNWFSIQAELLSRGTIKKGRAKRSIPDSAMCTCPS